MNHYEKLRMILTIFTLSTQLLDCASLRAGMTFDILLSNFR